MTTRRDVMVAGLGAAIAITNSVAIKAQTAHGFRPPSTTSAPMGRLRVTADLYINDIRASMSAKKIAGAGSPLARRYAFVGHLREAENTAAVIGLFVSMAAPIIPKVRPTVPTMVDRRKVVWADVDSDIWQQHVEF
jgi:hypothetical protein